MSCSAKALSGCLLSFYLSMIGRIGVDGCNLLVDIFMPEGYAGLFHDVRINFVLMPTWC